MISSKILLGFAVVALWATDVYGHGGMTAPPIRPITAKYRSECYFGLKGAGDEELQIAPLENLAARTQADQPTNPMFDMWNGCRGTVYESGNPVTDVTPGQSVPIEYRVQAPHPGYLEMGIVKKETGAGGKIMYKRVKVLSRTENFATTSTPSPLSVTIPSDVSGCSTPGECALQFYWHSDIAKQTYATCADITIKGSGSSPAAGTSPATPTATATGSTPSTPATPAANTPPNTPPTASTPNTPPTAPTPNTPPTAPTPNTPPTSSNTPPTAPTPNTPKKCGARL